MIGPLDNTQATYEGAERLSREVPHRIVRVYKVVGRPLRYVCFDEVSRDQIDGDDVLLLRSYLNGEITD